MMNILVEFRCDSCGVTAIKLGPLGPKHPPPFWHWFHVHNKPTHHLCPECKGKAEAGRKIAGAKRVNLR